MLRFQCPTCRAVLKVAASRAGTTAACPRCSRSVRIPGDAPAARRSSAWLVVALLVSVLTLVGIVVGYSLLPRVEPARTAELSPEPARQEVAKPPPVVEKKEEKPPPPPADDVRPHLQKILGQINAQRQAGGLPVLTLHDDHSRGSRDHAAYLVKHGGDDLDAHDQNLTLPGATAAGQQAARVASVVYGEPEAVVKTWLAAPAHRSLLCSPALKSLGLGAARDKAGQWVTVIDFVRGAPDREDSASEPILYPVPRQGHVPVTFPGQEVPDPIPKSKEKIAGYPITLQFAPGIRVGAVQAWLEDEQGHPVPAWLSTPTRPANEDYPKHQENTVCLIAHEPLRPGSRYVVRVEAAEWSRTWTFATEATDAWQQRLRTRVLTRLTLHRKAVGLDAPLLDLDACRACISHARYLTRNVGRVPGLRHTDERPDLPGYTEAGQKIARHTSNFQGQGVEPITCVEQMFAAVHYRPMALNPHLDRVGLGADQAPPAGWFWVVALPAVTSRKDGPVAVVYPGKDQTEVPINGGDPAAALAPEELPEEGFVGYPITASFRLRQEVRNVIALLKDATGNEVACWVSTPEKPLRGVGPFRQIVLVPKKLLTPKATYTVVMSADLDDGPWAATWRFTTVDPAVEEARIAKLLVERVNHFRALVGLRAVELDAPLSRACSLHAAYLARNMANPKTHGLGMHDEDPALPGYTKEGATAGERSVIALTPEPEGSVDGWIATLYHRLPLLDPRLRRIGYGQRLHPTRGWATVMDTTSGR